MASPIAGRSSLESLPRPFRRLVNSPFLPKKSTLESSRAFRSIALAIDFLASVIILLIKMPIVCYVLKTATLITVF